MCSCWADVLSRHHSRIQIRLIGSSATGFRPMRIALFSAIPGGFISRRSEVELRMAALRLYDLRAFAELSGGATHGVLLFLFPGRWLIPSITVVVGHATS
jgi:hypothetical protein